MNVLGVILSSYLIGSIPFGIIVSRLAGGIDIRHHGSRSSGATNVLRTLGKKYGILVFCLDFAKGLVSVWIARQITDSAWLWSLAAFLAVIGHIYPVFVGFKGGRGVATGVGGLMMLVPIAVLISFSVWALIVYTTRYVSLGSILGSLTTIIVSGVQYALGHAALPMFLYCCIAGSLIIIAHRANIARLRAGTESKLGQRAAPR